MSMDETSFCYVVPCKENIEMDAIVVWDWNTQKSDILEL